MAITDNTFTPEELSAAIAASPALIPHLVGAVKSSGYVARTADEETQFIGTKTKEIYDGLDRDIFDTSGIAKNPTEKTYDYAKRVVGGFKTDLTARQQTIADLEKTIKEGNGDATMKAQLEKLQQQESEWKGKEETYTKQLFQKDVRLDIRDGRRNLKFDPSVKESVLKVVVDNAETALLNMAAEQQNADGTTSVVYIRDGKTILNDKDQPADAAYILADMLKDVVDTGQQGAGGGAGGQGSGGNGGAGGTGRKALPTSLPATVKSQGQLMDFLKEFGLGQDTKEYDEAWDKLGGDKLPMR